MRRFMVFVVGALAVGVLACGGKKEESEAGAKTAENATSTAQGAAPKAIDLTDNKEVEKLAMDALLAYREKNVERLAELGPPGAKEKTIFIEPRNPNYEKLLGDDSWRMKSLKAWDGKSLVKLERGIDVAFGWYYQDEGFKYAVEVRKDNGRWAFHDLVQRPLQAAVKAP